MSTLEPRELPRRFLEAMNSGDVDAIVSLYEAEGVIAVNGNHIVAGHEAIRSMVSGVLAQRPRFALHESDAVQAGDLALVRSRWTVAMADAAGKQTEMHVGPTLVVRRHADGSWLVAIDRPSPNITTGSAIPILPAVDLSGTRAFFESLGFKTGYWSPAQERGYAILTREDLELHFFSHPHFVPADNYAGCYWRVQDADALHGLCSTLGLPASGTPSLSPVEDKPWGMREFALVDPNSNLIRVGHEIDGPQRSGGAST
jgi:uncharacterized protein (TIGR02246 family)